MPRVSKKQSDKESREKDLKLESMNMKPSNSSKEHKKIKTALNKYNKNLGRSQSYHTFENKDLTISNSSDSVIYLGSYNLSERYPVIDLTKSMASFQCEEMVAPLHRYPNLLNYHSVFTGMGNCNRNRSLACTASTSRLLDSLEGTKLHLKRNSKSASCLIVVDDNKHPDKFQTDILEKSHIINYKEKSHLDQATNLTQEDHNFINSSLEIGEDFQILKNCNPQIMMNSNVAIEKLMDIYQVNSVDDFI
ncbi:hypothetical protein HHI36_005022 [Cryptolaemus montrouzieri]|uniref:Uncharacterized protein n=1 Tax=Cryptolaemus montrouzieri TaxID=559131 RepID=A0ABD2NTF5_9CUCU